MSDHDQTTEYSSGINPCERRTGTGRAAFALRVLQVRLRFLVVLAAIFAVLALWNYAASFADWVITRLTGTGARPEHVSPDTEYFCPMCPGVLSNWPEKCPVCKMPLVRRRKGDAALLPEGVLARMQLSPQRLQLAGVQTSEVRYEELERTWDSAATVEIDPAQRYVVRAPARGHLIQVRSELLWNQVSKDQVLATLESSNAPEGVIDIRAPADGHLLRIASNVGDELEAATVLAEVADLHSIHVVTQVPQSDLPLIQVGQQVELVAGQDTATSHIGHVIAIQPALDHPTAPAGVLLAVEANDSGLLPGTIVTAKWRIPLANMEPFRSMPRELPPLSPNDPREMYACADHPTYLHSKDGTCPFDERPLEARLLAVNQRAEWYCPAHSEITSNHPEKCDLCSGLPLLARVVSYSPAGQVLAIPDSAVIDTGRAQIVFVETGPGMFDAVPIEVGPRCDEMRAVIRGIEAGQRVVSNGAFLLDAETRLTSNLSAAYFGAGSRTSKQEDDVIENAARSASPAIAKLDLPPGDTARALLQKTCPATGFALGSMGTPVRLFVGEHVVYLCCAGCKSKVKGAVEQPIDDHPAHDHDQPLAPAGASGS